MIELNMVVITSDHLYINRNNINVFFSPLFFFLEDSRECCLFEHVSKYQFSRCNAPIDSDYVLYYLIVRASHFNFNLNRQ